MRSRLRTPLLTVVLALIVAGPTCWLSQLSSTKELILNDSDVTSITAEVFKEDMILVGAPPTEIPAEYVPKILAALRPIVTVRDRRGLWDDLHPLGKLVIRKQDGNQIEIAFRWCGQNRLEFEYNGVRCRRGGAYEPIYNIVHQGVRLGYGDESELLAHAITEIHHEAENGVKSHELPDLFEDLERSAGKLPPK